MAAKDDAGALTVPRIVDAGSQSSQRAHPVLLIGAGFPDLHDDDLPGAEVAASVVRERPCPTRHTNYLFWPWLAVSCGSGRAGPRPSGAGVRAAAPTRRGPGRRGVGDSVVILLRPEGTERQADEHRHHGREGRTCRPRRRRDRPSQQGGAGGGGTERPGGGAAGITRLVGAAAGSARPRRAARGAGGDAGAGAGSDPVRADAHLAVRVLPGRRPADGRGPRRYPSDHPEGPALRRRPSLQLRRVRGARPAARVQRQRLRRDTAGPLRVGPQAPRGQLCRRRPSRSGSAARSGRW